MAPDACNLFNTVADAWPISPSRSLWPKTTRPSFSRGPGRGPNSDARQLLAHIAAQAEQLAAKDAEIERLKVELTRCPDSFWVFEAYQDEGAPAPRYWGGEERGYTWKINEAVRFLQREDVERYAKGRRLGGMGRPVEHKYAFAPQPKDQSR